MRFFGGDVQFEIKSARAPPKNKAWWRLKRPGGLELRASWMGPYKVYVQTTNLATGQICLQF